MLFFRGHRCYRNGITFSRLKKLQYFFENFKFLNYPIKQFEIAKKVSMKFNRSLMFLFLRLGSN